MSDLENQMGLFELAGIVETPTPQAPPAPAPAAPPAPQAQAQAPAQAESKTRPKRSRPSVAAPPAPKKTDAHAVAGSKRGRLPKGAVKAVSGLVPEGDVRLTANIRQDLHLKLKIASAYRRITIGEIIEELVEKYV